MENYYQRIKVRDVDGGGRPAGVTPRKVTADRYAEPNASNDDGTRSRRSETTMGGSGRGSMMMISLLSDLTSIDRSGSGYLTSIDRSGSGDLTSIDRSGSGDLKTWCKLPYMTKKMLYMTRFFVDLFAYMENFLYLCSVL